MTSCDTVTISENAFFEAKAGTSYRLISTPGIDFELVLNDRYSACVTINRIH